MMEMIARADDLGYSEAVNYGIVKSVKEGIINNVGLMINMPYSEHGYELISKYDICLGLHANISAGEPISDIETVASLVEGTHFKTSSLYHNSSDDVLDIDEIVLELQNQVYKFKEVTGFLPHYIDVHAILSPKFIKAAEIVANQNHISFVGINFKDDTIQINNTNIKMCIEDGKDDDAFNNSFIGTILNYPDNDIPLLVYHPGFIDTPLIRSSSLVMERAVQASFLTSAELKETVAKYEINFLRIDEVWLLRKILETVY